SASSVQDVLRCVLRYGFLMRNFSSYWLFTLGLSVLWASMVAAQSNDPKKSAEPAESSTRSKSRLVSATTTDSADKAKETPAVPARSEPVKYTELKKTLWPPKTGVKTAGVQIPMTKLKPDAEVSLPALVGSLLFTTDQVLISIPSADQIV